MRRFTALLASAAVTATGLATPSRAQPCGTIVGDADVAVPTTIVAPTTWGGAANPGPICLDEPVYVGEGTPATATLLTVLPGTVVRGQPRQGPIGVATDNPGALIVTRFSRIDAVGTATAPIVLTTAAVDNDDDGVCDDGDGDGLPDRHPGFRDDPPGCIGTGTCGTPQVAADARFCDEEPLAGVLSPLDADGRANVGLWGGLAILGNAPTNLANNVWPVEIGEGVLGSVRVPGAPQALVEYGGPDPDHDAGRVRFVSVRHTGAEIAPGEPVAGVALAGVGSGTVYEFVETYVGTDDGHAWLGGTVNGNHLVAAYPGNDALDVDQGHAGNLQFLLAVLPFFREEGGGPFGLFSGDTVAQLEGTDGVANLRTSRDAIDADVLARPFPFPGTALWNLTAIGSTPDGANPAAVPAAPNEGLRMQAGFAGQVVNGIVVNTGAAPCVGGLADAPGDSTPGFLAQDNAAADLSDLRATTCTSAPDPALFDPSVVLAGGAVLVREDPNHDASSANGVFPEAGMTQLNGYDPRPLLPAAGEVPREESLDRAADFHGAFEAGAAELWTTGWTALEIGNVLSR